MQVRLSHCAIQLERTRIRLLSLIHTVYEVLSYSL